MSVALPPHSCSRSFFHDMIHNMNKGFIQREVALLLAGVLIAIPVFLLTRKAADWNHQAHLNTAAYWYAQGNQQLQRKEVPAAIESFHFAAVNDHNNRRYGLALASALTAAGRDTEARTALLRWREATPEDPEINLQLARLARKQDNPIDALRYYHYAIFGVWAENAPPDRRISLQFELAEWLLGRGQHGPAIAELIALKSELPEGRANTLRLSRDFLSAGDVARALQGYQHLLAVDHNDPEARAGVVACAAVTLP